MSKLADLYVEKLRSTDGESLKFTIQDYSTNLVISIQTAAETCRKLWEKIHPGHRWPLSGKYLGNTIKEQV